MKTSLEKYFRTFPIPLTEDFIDGYDDDDFDLAVLDEFKGHKTMQWLNLWCQGSMTNFRVKGSQVIKKKHIPTIIISNYNLEECYSKAGEERLDPLRRRLEIVEVLEPINIPFQQKQSGEATERSEAECSAGDPDCNNPDNSDLGFTLVNSDI